MPPLHYVLLKIHKPSVPLRPIASFVTSPLYQLSKHLVHLSLLVGKTLSYVRNSVTFVQFISYQTTTSDAILVSFDVVSLFTNVPVELECRMAEEQIKNNKSLEERTALSPDEVQ